MGRVGSRLDFRILGPLEVRGADGVITITSRKQRALLVALLLDVGHAVSTDRLIDRLWNGGPPPQARVTLRSYISNLRRELDEAGAGAVLATRPNGYGLEVDPESVDVVRFERHVEDTRRALASGSPDEALRHADAGLALWRGEPLADAAYDDFAQSAIARLRNSTSPCRSTGSTRCCASGGTRRPSPRWRTSSQRIRCGRRLVDRDAHQRRALRRTVTAFAWDRGAAWRRMPITAFLTDFGHTMSRADQIQPAWLIIAIGSTAGYALDAPSGARLLAAGAGAGFLLVLLLSDHPSSSCCVLGRGGVRPRPSTRIPPPDGVPPPLPLRLVSTLEHPGHKGTLAKDHRGGAMSTNYGPAPTPDQARDNRRPLPSKTSAAAVFALVFGLSSLFCALALFLAPLGVLFGLIALVLGVVGLGKARLPGVTGRGVAIGGLVLGVLGLLLGIALVAGVASFLSNDANLDRIETQLQDLRDEIPTEVPGD